MTITNWFLSSLPDFLKELESAILIAEELTSPASQQKPAQPTQTIRPTTLAISTQNSSKLKGFVTISTTSITKGELTVKTPHYNRGHSLKLTIDTSHPIELMQIKMARNCIRKSLAMVQDLLRGDGGGTQIHVTNHVLSRILSLIQQAQSSLSTQDPKQMFPNLHHSTFAEAPLDCAVDFTIQDTLLITTFTCLNLPESNPIEHALSQLKNLQIIKLQNGKSVHVIDKIVVETTLPMLVELKNAFGRIEALTLDFSRKFKAIF